MKSAYQIIRRPVITEKGLGVKESEATLVFEVSSKASKTEIKNAVQSIFKVKVEAVRTANFVGKERRRGKFTGYRPPCPEYSAASPVSEPPVAKVAALSSNIPFDLSKPRTSAICPERPVNIERKKPPPSDSVRISVLGIRRRYAKNGLKA